MKCCTNHMGFTDHNLIIIYHNFLNLVHSGILRWDYYKNMNFMENSCTFGNSGKTVEIQISGGKLETPRSCFFCHHFLPVSTGNSEMKWHAVEIYTNLNKIKNCDKKTMSHFLEGLSHLEPVQRNWAAFRSYFRWIFHSYQQDILRVLMAYEQTFTRSFGIYWIRTFISVLSMSCVIIITIKGRTFLQRQITLRLTNFKSMIFGVYGSRHVPEKELGGFRGESFCQTLWIEMVATPAVI